MECSGVAKEEIVPDELVVRKEAGVEGLKRVAGSISFIGSSRR
jgi:hypothetical protein